MSTLKLNVDSLNVRFVNGKKEMHAVRDVSFTLGREKLAIVGESGSGKTTIGRAAIGLIPIKEGKLEIVGKDISHARPKELSQIRRHTGIVFQHFPRMWNGSRDNRATATDSIRKCSAYCLVTIF